MAGAATLQRTAAVPVKAPGAAKLSRVACTNARSTCRPNRLFQLPCFASQFAGIRRPVVQNEAIEKDNLTNAEAAQAWGFGAAVERKMHMLKRQVRFQQLGPATWKKDS